MPPGRYRDEGREKTGQSVEEELRRELVATVLTGRRPGGKHRPALGASRCGRGPGITVSGSDVAVRRGAPYRSTHGHRFIDPPGTNEFLLCRKRHANDCGCGQLTTSVVATTRDSNVGADYIPL